MRPSLFQGSSSYQFYYAAAAPAHACLLLLRGSGKIMPVNLPKCTIILKHTRASSEQLFFVITKTGAYSGSQFSIALMLKLDRTDITLLPFRACLPGCYYAEADATHRGVNSDKDVRRTVKERTASVALPTQAVARSGSAWHVCRSTTKH